MRKENLLFKNGRASERKSMEARGEETDRVREEILYTSGRRARERGWRKRGKTGEEI